MRGLSPQAHAAARRWRRPNRDELSRPGAAARSRYAVEAGRAVSGVAPSDASTAPGVASAARLRR